MSALGGLIGRSAFALAAALLAASCGPGEGEGGAATAARCDGRIGAPPAPSTPTAQMPLSPCGTCRGGGRVVGYRLRRAPLSMAPAATRPPC